MDPTSPPGRPYCRSPRAAQPRPEDARQTDREQALASSPIHRLTSRATRAVRGWAGTRTAAVSDTIVSSLRPFTSAERALPIAVASIVAVAALLAFLPTTPQGAVSGIQGATSAPRLAVGGSERDPRRDTIDDTGVDGAPAAALGPEDTSFTPITLPGEVQNNPVVEPSGGVEPTHAPGSVVAPTATDEPETAVQDDGTLITGYAPETTVEDGADLIRTYKVQKGDTLQAVAKKFDVSMMTLWWANKLKKKDLRSGQLLRIPPVSGLVYTVKDTDTLATVAKSHKVSASRIVAMNGLEDPTLVVGQVLVLPGAKGAPMPTPNRSRSSIPTSRRRAQAERWRQRCSAGDPPPTRAASSTGRSSAATTTSASTTTTATGRSTSRRTMAPRSSRPRPAR